MNPACRGIAAHPCIDDLISISKRVKATLQLRGIGVLRGYSETRCQTITEGYNLWYSVLLWSGRIG